MNEHETRRHVRVHEPDEQIVGLVRTGDPLPDAAAFERELLVALPRTRSAVADAAGAAPPVVAFTTYRAPWGQLHLAVTGRGLAAIELWSTTPDFLAGLQRRFGGPIVPDHPGLPAGWRDLLDRTRIELDEYFASVRATFDLPVDLRGISDWDRRVLAGTRDVDYGAVSSYGRLAAAIGKPGAARAVGGALGRNPVPLVIPCHRILAGDGSLGGYGGGHGSRREMLAIKRSLLQGEGVLVPA